MICFKPTNQKIKRFPSHRYYCFIFIICQLINTNLAKSNTGFKSTDSNQVPLIDNNIHSKSIDSIKNNTQDVLSGITNFPYTQTFDDWQLSWVGTCSPVSTVTLEDNWVNIEGDDMDFSIHSGSTSSSGTGPSDDITGGGNYIYLESSSCNNSTGIVISPEFDFSNLVFPNISFYYHMYGMYMGSLELDVSIDGQNSWTNIWSISGNQNDQWHEQFIVLANYGICSEPSVYFRWVGTTGQNWWSDIAIDHIDIGETPMAPAPFGLDAINITSISADLIWNYSTNCLWPANIEYGLLGHVLGTGTIIGDVYSPYQIPDFTPDTEYDFYVQMDYSGILTGWTGPETFTTALPEQVMVNLKVLLEGPYNGTSLTSDLNNGGILPLLQPYSELPWNYNGGETVGSIPNPNVVDWILIELYDAIDVASVSETTLVNILAAFILADGSVVGMDGISNLVFNHSVINQLFTIIRHRNHLDILSANPLTDNSGIYSYDFTTGFGQTFGTDSQKDLGGGKFGMYAGDANADGIIDLLDKSINWSETSGNTGYLISDINMDGQADNPDKNELWLENVGKVSQVPD